MTQIQILISVFLIQAIPPPVASFKNEPGKIATFNQLVEFLFWRGERTNIQNGDFNVLLVGGGPFWVRELRRQHFNAFALNDTPATPWEVRANIFHYPIRPHTMAVTGYLLHSPSNPWVSMRLLSEAVGTIIPGGFLFFDPLEGTWWPKYLETMQWEKLPFGYYQYQIWRKPDDRRDHHGITVIKQAA